MLTATVSPTRMCGNLLEIQVHHCSLDARDPRRLCDGRHHIRSPRRSMAAQHRQQMRKIARPPRRRGTAPLYGPAKMRNPISGNERDRTKEELIQTSTIISATNHQPKCATAIQSHTAPHKRTTRPVSRQQISGSVTPSIHAPLPA